MRQPSLCLALACALGATTLPAPAQQLDDRAVAPTVAKQQKAEVAKRGDPARWYRAPKTEEARLQLQKQEIAAAYTQAKTACQKASSGRAKCLREARTNYQHDMANAPKQLAEVPRSGVLERVVVQYETPAPGESQIGASQAGATEAGTTQPAAAQPAAPQPGLPRSDAAAPDQSPSGATPPDQPRPRY
jgi:hypothetical protein